MRMGKSEREIECERERVKVRESESEKEGVKGVLFKDWKAVCHTWSRVRSLVGIE